MPWMTWRDESDEADARDLPQERDLTPDDDEWETVPCPNCGRDVAEEAEMCPHCGEFIVHRSAKRSRRVMAIAVVLLLVLVLWMVLG